MRTGRKAGESREWLEARRGGPAVPGPSCPPALPAALQRTPIGWPGSGCAGRAAREAALGAPGSPGPPRCQDGLGGGAGLVRVSCGAGAPRRRALGRVGRHLVALRPPRPLRALAPGRPRVPRAGAPRPGRRAAGLARPREGAAGRVQRPLRHLRGAGARAGAAPPGAAAAAAPAGGAGGARPEGPAGGRAGAPRGRRPAPAPHPRPGEPVPRPPGDRPPRPGRGRLPERRAGLSAQAPGRGARRAGRGQAGCAAQPPAGPGGASALQPRPVRAPGGAEQAGAGGSVSLPSRLRGRAGPPQAGGRAHHPPGDRRVPPPAAVSLGRRRGLARRHRPSDQAAGQPGGDAGHRGGPLPGKSGRTGAGDFRGQGGNDPVPAGIPGAAECQDGLGHGNRCIQETAGGGGDVVEFFAKDAEMMGRQNFLPASTVFPSLLMFPTCAPPGPARSCSLWPHLFPQGLKPDLL